jgi:ABC-type transport system involved in multi-copper enzyme maturation permease subunit
VARVFAVTLAAVLVAGSLGSTLALWREKTFQTLALTALLLVAWIAAWEAVARWGMQISLLDRPLSSWAVAFHPIRAVLVAAQPWADEGAGGQHGLAVGMFCVCAAVIAALLNAWAVWRVRIWNPSRELQRGSDPEAGPAESIWGAEHDLIQEAAAGSAAGLPTASASEAAADQARAGHVDSQLRQDHRELRTREVWDNPILWREICTWAYGQKVIVIRSAYLPLVIAAAVGLFLTSGTDPAPDSATGLAARIPTTALLLAPFFLLSLVIVNALAVTSITDERDSLTLDLLLATDISPKEFIFGKLFGIFWVTKMMVLAPVLLCLGLWLAGGVGVENLGYVLGGLMVLNVFVATLGIHCGITYANSRTAIIVSLGTVFFLFLGVVACILMMISFSGSFQGQLAPFLAFIVGGGVGLYVSLGARNPSSAISIASILVPFATFYAITSFILEYTLSVFLVTVAAYGFTTAALLIPAVYEFDAEMGRTSGP